MWIFLNDAMFSVVQHRKFTDSLLVRARIKGDIERVFPDANVEHTPYADYAYRSIIGKKEFADKVHCLITDICYDNFKNSIPDGHDVRHNAYMGVWSAMRRAQQDSFQITGLTTNDWTPFNALLGFVASTTVEDA